MQREIKSPNAEYAEEVAEDAKKFVVRGREKT
jgi:hypothetical protein